MPQTSSSCSARFSSTGSWSRCPSHRRGGPLRLGKGSALGNQRRRRNAMRKPASPDKASKAKPASPSPCQWAWGGVKLIWGTRRTASCGVGWVASGSFGLAVWVWLGGSGGGTVGKAVVLRFSPSFRQGSPEPRFHGWYGLVASLQSGFRRSMPE